MLGAFLTTTAPVSAADDCQTFSETGFQVCGKFLTYWKTHGGLAQQGFPISNVADEQNAPPPAGDGKVHKVQYFQRARFEEHLENQPPYDTLLGLLGGEQVKVKYGNGLPAPDSTYQSNDCQTFAETGFKICGRFKEYWNANGGLAQQGFPISPVFEEQNAPAPAGDGKVHRVQYFQRARFEEHLENARPYDVLLGLLGAEQLKVKNTPPPPPPPPPTTVSQACKDTPDPVSARVRPGKCVKPGTELSIDIFGFTPNEQVGFWLTDPNDRIVGTVKTSNIGATGAVNGLNLGTTNLEKGRWYFVFEGVSSKHKSIVYFLLEDGNTPPPGPAPTACSNVPDPVSGRIRPSKCFKAGTVYEMDIFGFNANEKIGYWITTPDGLILGTRKTYQLGSSGATTFKDDSTDLPKGLYYWVFQGTSNGHQTVIYFEITD